MTSEALFAFAAYPLFRLDAADDNQFSLRWVGLVKLSALWAFTFFAAMSLLRAGRTTFALGVCTVALLLMTDPAVVLYANGFYAEYAAALFLFASAVATAIALDTRSTRWAVVGCLAIIGLATSKVQHFPLGVTVAILATLVALRFKLPRAIVAWIWIGAIAGLAVQGWHLQSDRTASMRYANLTNTVLYTVFAEAESPHEVARTLGLPSSCGDHAGKNWFTPGMQEKHVCPEIGELSRARILSLAFSHPIAFGRVLIGGVKRMRPWIPAGLGLVEGLSMGTLPSNIPTTSRLLDVLHVNALIVLVFSAPAIGLFVLFRARSTATSFVLPLLAALPPIVLLIVVFGDGYADTAKQSHLGTLSLLAFYCATVLALCGVAASRLLGRPSRRTPGFTANSSPEAPPGSRIEHRAEAGESSATIA